MNVHANTQIVWFVYTGQESSNQSQARNAAHVRVASSVEEIPAQTFAGSLHHPNSRLIEVRLREGLLVIGSQAFLWCSSLTTINIPSTVNVIGEFAFYGCQSLLEVDLPEGLQTIEEYLFFGCISLRRVKIPSTVTRILRCAFHSCGSLISLDLPVGLQFIGMDAFAKCSALTIVGIPSTVTQIDKRAFSNCKKLLSVELPEGLERIGNFAFRDCESLVNVFVESTIPLIGDDSFNIRCTKLFQAVPDEDDDNGGLILLNVLKNRFDDLPIHKICYHHSQHPLQVNLDNLNQALEADPAAAEKMDSFGMTPFHILALSAKPSPDLFQSLLRSYASNNVLDHKDMYGNTPLNYAFRNCEPNTSQVIKYILHATLDHRLEGLGLKRWRQDITNEIENFPNTDDLAFREHHVAMIRFKLEESQQLEALSLLESVLWKRKNYECNATQSMDRRNNMINCGAGIVIPNVLLFLDAIEAPNAVRPEL